MATTIMPGGSATLWKECKVDIKNGKCSCRKYASFGMPGGRATHCKECKEQGMVDVKNLNARAESLSPSSVCQVARPPIAKPARCRA